MLNKKMTIFEATSIIQELVTDPNSDIGIGADELEKVLRQAKAGNPNYIPEAKKIVGNLLDAYGISVKGKTTQQAIDEIYRYLWGLDVIESLYNSAEVNEIRANGPSKIFYQENGKNRRSNDLAFKDDEHVHKIITRLVEHDRANLDESNPGIESMRTDGARITALGPPVTKEPMLVLRKHGTFEITAENYVQSGTMSDYIVQLLTTLAKGRANILISGGTNTGKTTLLRWLAGYHDERLRTITVETDRELFLDEWYPERDIVSMEAHPEIHWDMKRCFEEVLRFSPDIVIVGEARGMGEAKEMIDSCRSGHHGSMGTVHVLSVYEAVNRLAQMAMEEGRRLPIDILEYQIAGAFDVIVQMYGNSITGTKKIERVAEVYNGEQGPEFRDLVTWKPSELDYEKGNWAYPNGLSKEITSKLFKYGVDINELHRLEELRMVNANTKQN